MVDYKNGIFAGMTIISCVFEEFAVNLLGLRGVWLRTISYGDSPRVFVNWYLYDDWNNLTSVDHSV